MKTFFLLTISLSAFMAVTYTSGQAPQPNTTVVTPQPTPNPVDGFIVANGTIYYVSQGNATVLPDSLRLTGTPQGINGFPQLMASLQPGAMLTLGGLKVAAPANITFGANADGTPLNGVKPPGTNADGSPMGNNRQGKNADGSPMGNNRQGTNADGSPMGNNRQGTNADGSPMGNNRQGTNADGSPMGGVKTPVPQNPQVPQTRQVPQPPQTRPQPVAPPVAPAKKP